MIFAVVLPFFELTKKTNFSSKKSFRKTRSERADERESISYSPIDAARSSFAEEMAPFSSDALDKSSFGITFPV